MTYDIDIAGLKRSLPLCRVTDDLYIGAFVIFGDVELTVHCAAELLKRAPDYDYLIAPEAKAIPLVYEMSRQSGIPYLLARKKAKASHHEAAAIPSGRAMYVSASGYSAYDPGNSKHTASGTLVRHGVIAVDPNVIPLGTHVFIPGYGDAVAEDIGGSIHGQRIDVAFDTHEEALAFGRRDLEIIIVD